MQGFQNGGKPMGVLSESAGRFESPQGTDTPGVAELPRGNKTPGVTIASEGVPGEDRQRQGWD